MATPVFSNIPQSSTSTFTHSPTSSSPAHVDKRATAGAIAAGVVGGIACIAIIAIIYFCYFYRGPRRRSPTLDLLGPAENASTSSQQQLQDKPVSDFTLPLTPPPPVHHHEARSSVAIPHPPVPSPVVTIPSLAPDLGRARPAFPSRLQIANPDASPILRGRTARQAELKQQMEHLREEIAVLTAELKRSSGSLHPGSSTASSSSRDPSRANTPIPELRAQIQALTEQVAFLQTQQSSPWERSLSFESPPTYSPGKSVLGNSSLLFIPDTKSKA
ncbi:hypothetical protein NP233_g115 [Leucocoprinus birnbaumii]|uniref:Uncharacterized protein n=1 Tax=Leucocoprinus birnbaumii TaxID=56174 RepID=A0AAD5W4N5_9AGAR|nr:hypothetical protein NP233_g115 [Leucocoprinus birnbaumii]